MDCGNGGSEGPSGPRIGRHGFRKISLRLKVAVTLPIDNNQHLPEFGTTKVIFRPNILPCVTKLDHCLLDWAIFKNERL